MQVTVIVGAKVTCRLTYQNEWMIDDCIINLEADIALAPQLGVYYGNKWDA